MHSTSMDSRCTLAGAVVALLAFGPIAQPLAAQRPGQPIEPSISNPVAVGSRVRVTVAPDAERARSQTWIGELIHATSDSIAVGTSAGADVVWIPRSAITRVDVSAGRDRHPWKGFTVGFLVGAGTGALIGFASGDDRTCGDFICFSREELAFAAGAGLGVTGGVVGLLIGLVPTETWAPSGMAILPVVSRDGAGITLSVGLF